MTTPRVYILFIPYPGWLCESARTLAHIILRRRADGPLIVCERANGNSRRSKDWSKLRYTSRMPHVQAIFTDPEALNRAQAELRTFVPDLPVGVVRHERRRIHSRELPCTCILPAVRAVRAGDLAEMHTPFLDYHQVDTCPRHAQLLPRSNSQPLAPLVQQQVQELVQELPGRPSPEVLPVIDEPPALVGRLGKTNSAAQFVAKLAREGRKFALYG